MEDHAPYTACAVGDEDAGGASAEAPPRWLAVGCQDGHVLLLALAQGAVSGPVRRLRAPPLEPERDAAAGGAMGPLADAAPVGEALRGATGGTADPAVGITALQFAGREALFAGSEGRCVLWDLTGGDLRREFWLPRAGPRAAVPVTLAAVRRSGAGEGLCLWVGTDGGSIAVFDADSGVLVRNFSAGPETLVSLAHFPADGVVFALSAHRRVSVWDAASYSCIQQHPAELMTCGADLSAMVAVSIEEPALSLIMLAGVDGSLCIRRVSRRADGKLSCVLLSFRERASVDAAPVTCLSYHAATDSVLVGDAGCTVTVLSKLRDQLAGASAPPLGGGPGAAGRGAPAAAGIVPPSLSAGLAVTTGLPLPVAPPAEVVREGAWGLLPRLPETLSGRREASRQAAVC